jgi:hypothetical protein
MPPFDHDNLFAIYYLHSYHPAYMNAMRLVPTLLHIFEQRVKQHTASNTMFLQATIRNKLSTKVIIISHLRQHINILNIYPSTLDVFDVRHILPALICSRPVVHHRHNTILASGAIFGGMLVDAVPRAVMV